MTDYPFALAEALVQRLPHPARNGYCYLDVLAKGKWDGVLVVDGTGQCVGIFMGRQIRQEALPFAVEAIEDIRKASLWNRFVCSFPGDFILCAYLTIIFFSPVALAIAAKIPWVALLPVVGCVVSINVLYEIRGWPLIRFPAALLGFGQIIIGLLMIAASVLHLHHHHGH